LEQLNYLRSQHSESVELGGYAVVEGLGAFSIRDGNAHGKGKPHMTAKHRNAALTVNLAGSAASFLIETWEVRSHERRPGLKAGLARGLGVAAPSQGVAGTSSVV
jgi:hypothetical protein